MANSKYTSQLDDQSRDILNFKPRIDFVAPEVIAGIAEVLDEVVEDAALKNMRATRDLADNANKLAEAAQLRVDQFADFTAKLDPKVDAVVVQAMRRKYPTDDPNEITYDQYKRCKRNIGDKGQALADGIMVTPEKVVAASNQSIKDVAFATSADSQVGLNRPETSSQNQIIEPVDMDNLQVKLLKELSNMIWQTAIKPTVVGAATPVGKAFKALPDKIFPDQNIGVPGPIAGGNKNLDPQSAVQLNQGDDKTGVNENIAANSGANEQQADNPVSFGDCMTITRAYEKSANFATTEGAVYAMLTPHLQTIIAQTATVKKQIDSVEAVTNVKGMSEKIKDEIAKQTGDSDALSASVAPARANGEGMGSADERKRPLFTHFVPVDHKTGKREWDKVFDSKCIPCGFRFNLDFQLLDQLAAIGRSYYEQAKAWIKQQIAMIQDILSFLSSLDGSDIDMCGFVSFICGFVCVPDLTRIVALLSALLLKLSFEINSLFDIILGLIAPIVTPILSTLTTFLHQVIMMIVRPIECIIDAIVAQIRKLDYNLLFQNASAYNIHFSAGPFVDGIDVENDTRPTVPGTDQKVGFSTVKLGGTTRAVEANFNPLAATQAYQEKQNREKAEAERELAQIQQAGAAVDTNNPQAVQEHRNKLRQAQENVTDKTHAARESAIGRAANFVESFKPMLQQLVGYIQEIMAAVITFETKVYEELQKIMGQYIGGTGSALHLNFKKLGIIQMIQIVMAMLDVIQNGLPGCDCNNSPALDNIAANLSQNSPLTFWTDDEGNLHIDETNDDTEDAMDKIISALGGSGPGKTVLKSTGDPLLDTEISKTVEALTTPVSITLKCQKQTSVANAEQVNKWIAELDQE